MTMPVTSNCARGLSLIEVMIALLILSLGLVGLAALHLNSLSGTHASYYQSIASSVALDLEERAWVELATTDSGCPDFVTEDFIDHWDASNDDGRPGLPGLDVEVTEDDDALFPQWDVVVTWDEGRFDDLDDNREEFTYRMSVLCRE